MWSWGSRASWAQDRVPAVGPGGAIPVAGRHQLSARGELLGTKPAPEVFELVGKLPFGWRWRLGRARRSGPSARDCRLQGRRARVGHIRLDEVQGAETRYVFQRRQSVVGNWPFAEGEDLQVGQLAELA